MSIYSFEIENVQPSQVFTMLSKLQNFANVSGQGPWKIEGSGIVATAEYSLDRKVVRVEILEKPFIVTVGLIKQRVLEALSTQEAE